MTRVFWTSTSTPTDGSTRESSSTTSTEWKNVPPPPPNALGNLDAHQSHPEQLGQERRGPSGRSRPCSRVRRECRGRELVTLWRSSRSSSVSVVRAAGRSTAGVVTENPHGWGRRRRPGRRGRCVERKRSRTGNASASALCATAGLVMLSSLLRMIRPGFRSAVVFLTLSATLVGAAAQQSSAPASQARPAQPDPASQAPPPTPPQGGGADCAAGQPPPQDQRATHTADLPDRHQFRARGRDRQRQGGTPGRRPQARRLRGAGGRQAAVHRDVQADSRRRQPAAG